MDQITSAADLEIYNDNQNFQIFAGPGAGKTHLLIENIRYIVQNSKKLKANNKRKILCITYTNAAVDEIKSRLGSYSKYVTVSTIHSFLSEYVIKPFPVQLKKFVEAEFKVKVPTETKLASVQEGFTVLSGHKKESVYEFIKSKCPDIPEISYNTLSRTKMCKIELNISQINQYPFNDSANVDLKLESLPAETAWIIKEYIWCCAGKLSFDEILYFGLSMIKQYKFILLMLRAEFPYILMDEYQDTNPIQNKILNILSKKEVIVGVVGDIAQSIFSFQGATYHEFKDFSLSSQYPIAIRAITGNRRSNQNIINLINYIRKGDGKFQQECTLNTGNKDLVTFLIQKNDTLNKPILELLATNTYILCRRWVEAFNYIDDVSKEQKTLINSIYNAYTYQIQRDINQAVEAGREAWIGSVLDIAKLEKSCKNKDIPGALSVAEKYLDIKDILKDFNKSKMQQLNQVVKTWESLFRQDLDNILIKDLIVMVNTAFENVPNVKAVNQFKYPKPEDEEYIEPVYTHIDKLEYSCAKKIILELFSENAKHMTIHKAKGREFENVLVNLEPFARGPEKNFNAVNLFVNPVIMNHENFAYEEYTRLAYVGCSRAINKLYIHLHGDESTAANIDTALKAHYKDDPDKQNFYDFVYC